MAEQKFTRCPACKTIFRVTSAQLAIREGQVRCGHCRAVFDGVSALLSLAPNQRNAREEPEFDEAALGPPTVTLRSAHALEPQPDADAREEAAALPGTEPADAENNYAARFSWQEKRTRRRLPSWVYWASIPLLVILLPGQVLFHYRDAIAAHWPALKPALGRLCFVSGCQVRPLVSYRDLPWVPDKEQLLVVEGSELQADPAHKGLLIFSATIRNRASYPLAYPDLELTLTDVQKQTGQDLVVVRRVFSPQEYASGAAEIDRGIPGRSELNVKLFIDASATTQAGYQVYLFYP